MVRAGASEIEGNLYLSARLLCLSGTGLCVVVLRKLSKSGGGPPDRKYEGVGKIGFPGFGEHVHAELPTIWPVSR